MLSVGSTGCIWLVGNYFFLVKHVFTGNVDSSKPKYLVGKLKFEKLLEHF